MKKYIGILIIAAACSCNQPNPTVPEKKMEPMAVKDSTKSDLAKLVFASAKDLSCGMPITAGVSDTATYKGNLYGFCSAECKEDFLKNAATLLKAK
jgi:YHS domain-containing protein